MGWFTRSKEIRPEVLEKCRFEIEKAPPRSALRKWVSWAVTFPFTIPERVYNTYLLFKHKELREPAAKNLCPMRAFSPLRTLFFTFNMTKIPELMKTILRHARKDPEEGFFNDQENKQVFLLMCKDLYPGTKIEEEDSLLTCSKGNILKHRQPVLSLMAASKIKNNSHELVKVAEDVIGLYRDRAEINATEMAFTFTTTVISRLLLGHPGPIAKYTEISTSLDCLNRIVLKKAWHQKISPEELAQYERALAVVREAIELAQNKDQSPPLGSFVKMTDGELTPNQTRIALFNLFFAGSETAASLLAYMFWQLGRHPEWQEAIFKEVSGPGDLFELAEKSAALNKFFAESIRVFTPGYLISRRAATDLICRARDESGNVVFEQRISEGEGLTPVPTFAARDPSKYPNPDLFDPNRFEEPPKVMDWRPFGDGAHSCPGQSLAKYEVLTLVAAVIRECTFESTPRHELGQAGLLTLKPKEEVHIIPHKRP